MKPVWVTMMSGSKVNLLDFKLEDVNFDDIAYSLSRSARFAGNVLDNGYPLTVAEHSITVSDLLTGSRGVLAGLMHDAHEAYVGDIITPVVRALGIQDEVHALKNHIQMRIHEAAGLPAVLDGDTQRLVDWADKEAFRIENAARFALRSYMTHDAARFSFTERMVKLGVAA